MQFHENFKRIANDRGTTPTAVLRDLNIATSKIAAWNKGSLPKQETLHRLAEYLNCRVSDFFWDGEGDPMGTSGDAPKIVRVEVPKEPELDEDEQEVLRTFKSLSRREKHEFMVTVYDYAKAHELAGDDGASAQSAHHASR